MQMRRTRYGNCVIRLIIAAGGWRPHGDAATRVVGEHPEVRRYDMDIRKSVQISDFPKIYPDFQVLQQLTSAGQLDCEVTPFVDVITDEKKEDALLDLVTQHGTNSRCMSMICR